MYQAIVFLPLLGALVAGLFGTALFKNFGHDSQVYGDHTSHALGDNDHSHDDRHGHYHGPMWPMYLTTGLLFVACLLSWISFWTFLHEPHLEKIHVLEFISSGALQADWALRIDTLTSVMLVVVTTVSSLVHMYSLGYMAHDDYQPRFFAYLSLFTFAMLMLVTSDNLVQIFFGWEGVGLASYLLIGFWYTRPSANAAAIKAFIVNRVGDFGFALGIFGCFYIFQSVELDAIFGGAAAQVGKTMPFLSWAPDTITILCLLLFMGAMGKSAQFLLHTWLPDAMEGPTPVSALIHAATMVTAGVFLVARMSPMFEYSEVARDVVIVIGAVTAFFAATVGLVQNDIKRVIAYSTCSQLGYMFVAMGVGAYGVGMFHLFTHAFFKALLFLGAGSVIHAMSGEQDMRKMGGLAPHVRATWALMLIGTLALTGFPLTAGYFSKDAIIESAFASHAGPHMFAFALLVIAAFCTSFYSWRLAFMTFNGSPRADQRTMEHVHESGQVMLVPLYVLALGALIAGYVFAPYFIGHAEKEFWGEAIFRGAENHIVHEMHDVPEWVKYSPFVAMALGFLVAVMFYLRGTTAPAIKWGIVAGAAVAIAYVGYETALDPLSMIATIAVFVPPIYVAFAKRDGSLPAQLAATHWPVYQFLLNKWYFDELYDFALVNPAKWLGRFLWKKGDGTVIDGFGPDGVSARVGDLTAQTVKLQTGYVYHYAFAMLIGVAALVSWFSFGGGH